MAKINLLPWRAELRKQQQKQFLTSILLGILVTIALFMLVRTHISGKIDYQARRNQYLETEIKALDQKIKEIQDLETKKKRFLAKMEVIQQLQASRPEIVHLFDELARTVPDGVSLTDLAQIDKSLTLNGFAQSNARISAYMRNLETSPWLKDPVLNIIEAKNDPAKDARTKDRPNRFTLQVKQTSDKAKAKSAS